MITESDREFKKNPLADQHLSYILGLLERRKKIVDTNLNIRVKMAIEGLIGADKPNVLKRNNVLVEFEYPSGRKSSHNIAQDQIVRNHKLNGEYPCNIRIPDDLKKALLAQTLWKNANLDTRLGDGSDELFVSYWGEFAEFMAVCSLCPGFINDWLYSNAFGGNNYGKDLLKSWCGLNKHIEVKFLQPGNASCIFMRKPSKNLDGDYLTEKQFKEEIDFWLPDSYYMMYKMIKRFEFKLCGFTNKKTFIKHGKLEDYGKDRPKGWSMRGWYLEMREPWLPKPRKKPRKVALVR